MKRRIKRSYELFICLMIALSTSLFAQEPVYEALDPRGSWPEVARIPLAERLSTLENQKVYIIKSWNHTSGFDAVIPDLVEALENVGATPVIRDLNVSIWDADTELWAEMEANGADAFIYIAAASSSTTSYAFKWSSYLEKSGLPGVVVAFDQLASVGETTMLREGANLRSIEYSYPTTAMGEVRYRETLEGTLAALTEPLRSEESRTGYINQESMPEIMATGDLETIQRIFYENGFTDGLPIVPPTQERVEAMFTGTSHSSNEVVATQFYPEGLQVTVRQVAINAVMAGCLPEHMPVLLATIEAFQQYNLNSVIRSTNSFSFMQVVNGPIAQEINMNSGVNAIGPGNLANSCMGRALRLFVINLGGGAPGVNMMAVIGNVSTFSFMFAENEAQSPWEPFHVSQGFSANESTLTLFTGGWAHSGNYNIGSEFERIIADISRFESKSGATLLISPQRADALARQGMSKADVINYVWQNATAELGWLREDGFFRPTPEMEAMDSKSLVPIFPEGSINVIVTGGDASPMMQGWHMYRPQTVSIDKWR